MNLEEQSYMGIAEVAAYLDVSKQTIANWRRRREFPAPVADLKMGPIWATDEIMKFKATRRRQRLTRLKVRKMPESGVSLVEIAERLLRSRGLNYVRRAAT